MGMGNLTPTAPPAPEQPATPAQGAGGGGGPQDAGGTQPAAQPEAAPETISLPRAEVERIREENAKAKGYVVALTQQLDRLVNQRSEAPPLAPQERTQAIKNLLEEDPETALDAHFRERIAPIVSQNRQTLAAINKERAIEKIGTKEWGKWGPKIEEFMAPFDDSTKADPGAWENAYNFVRIKNVDDIVEERVREKLGEQQRAALLEGSSSNAAATRSDRQLSALEKTMAKEFNMTDEEWRKFGSNQLNQQGALEE